MKKYLVFVLAQIAFIHVSISQCASGATSNADSNVGNVVLNGDSQNINNSTAGVCAMYSNFTGLSAADLTIGSAYTTSVTQGTCGGDYGRRVNIWIDWNQNNDFTDIGDMIGTGIVNDATANLVTNFNFTVPPGAVLGNTTMRVIVREGGNATDPCASYTWGETEDYTVTILSAGPMTYTSSTTTQTNTSNISKCSNDQVIVGVEVVTTGSSAPLRLKDLRLRTDGSTNILSDVTNIDVYYTGNSNTYSATNLFGSAAPIAPGTNFFVSGNQLLAGGTNYFWVAYDIAPGATIGNNLDARCTRIVIADNADITNTNYTPAVINPVGNRTIEMCTPYPGGVNNGLTVWLDANSGALSGGSAALNGNSIDIWNNKVTNPSAPSVSGAGATRPVYSTNKFNFNNTLYFDGANDRLEAVWLGSDIIDASTNTMLIAHKYYGGTVIMKFSRNGIGGSFQYESNGANYRYDFMGANSFATPFVNEIDIFSTRTNHAGNLLINKNGTQEYSGAAPGAFPIADTKEFYIAENPQAAWPLNARMDLAEIIIYPSDLTDTELRNAESYLAIKYGVTLGTNGISIDYTSSGSNSIWTQASNAGYAFDIAGIANDEGSGLLQAKSHSENETTPGSGTYRDVLTIANGTNFATPVDLALDQSFLIWGHNGGATINTGAAVNYPTDNGETIEAIFLREWKSQETGTVGTVTLEFDMSAVLGVNSVPGTNDLANLRLLVDEDGDFTNGATSIAPSSFNNGTDIAYFQHNFQPTDGNNMTPNNGFFFTLASTNFTVTPLPVEIIEYTVEGNIFDQAVNTWIVKDELDIDYYAIDKSIDGLTWESVGTVTRTPDNQEQKTYTLLDENPYSGKSYYRLTEIDVDGEFGAEVIRPFETTSSIALNVFPNPSNGNLNIIIEGDLSEINDLLIINPLGQVVRRKSNLESHIVEIQDLRSGLHSVMILSKNGEKFVKKFVVR